MTQLSLGKHSRLIRKVVPYIPLLVFVTIAVVLAGISFQTFRHIEMLIVRDEMQDLGAIADLKIKQISDWRRMQIRQGESFQNGYLLPGEFDRWLRQGALPDARKQNIQEMLAGIQRLDGYQEVSLYDRQGLARVSTAMGRQPNMEYAALVTEAMHSQKVTMSDIYKSENNVGKIGIDLVAPLVVVDANGKHVVGAVVFQIDLHQFLYPLLQEWPTPSPSAETLLVRQDGNDVLFLNELRHLKGSALSLRIPLAAFTLPAVMAVLGKTSAMDGFDYRGVAVVSEMRRVPGTSWFMVSKIDKDELLAPVIRLKQWSLSMGLAFALLGAILLFVWLKANYVRQKLLREQHAAAIEREMLLKHFEYLTKYANDIILVVDGTGRFVEANQRAVETYGYTREELLRMRIPDIRPLNEDPSIFIGQIKQITELGALRFEDINRRKDGTCFPVEVSARFIEVQGVKYMQGILRDITVRKHAEEELRLHGAIVSHMEEGVFLISVRDGVIVYANPKFEQMFGYGLGELIGKHVSCVNESTYSDSKKTAEIINEALIRKGSWEGEVHNVKRDGTPFWCHARVSTLEHHHYGTVWVSIHQDITERKMAEARLSESEERFRSMADNAPIMIWMAEASDERQSRHCRACRSHFTPVWQDSSLPTLEQLPQDSHDCRTFFNQRWHDFTGLTSKPLQKHNWQLNVHPDDRANCFDTCGAAFLNARPFNLEYRLRRHDGAFRWVQDTGVPRFTEDGKLLGYIGTCVDITEQKAFEEMRTEIERIGRINIVGEMTSILAHELSQPLSAASIYLDGCLNRMTANDWDREKLMKAVRQAHLQTQRAGNIISHLKEMMRKQGCKRDMMDLNLIVKDSLNFLQQDLSRYSVSVIHDFSDLPLTSVNRIEIEQILLNLVKNAIDAMSTQLRRELRLSTRLIKDGMIMVTVSDTGAGIPREEMEIVFNPFQTTKQNGLGLGLGICRSLIENYGGQIWAEQRSDCGMEFNFTLPVVVTYE